MLLAVHYRVMKHMESLESTRKSFYRTLQTSHMLHNSRAYTKACILFIVNYQASLQYNV